MGLFEKKKTVELKIGGMHCQNCAAKVQKALGVLGKATVDLKLGRAKLSCPEKVTPEQIKSAVEAVGFTCDVI